MLFGGFERMVGLYLGFFKIYLAGQVFLSTNFLIILNLFLCTYPRSISGMTTGQAHVRTRVRTKLF